MIIEGFFENIKNANQVVSVLNELQVRAYVDIKDDDKEDQNVMRNVAGTETGTSLSELTLNSGNGDLDASKAPIAAADPMASGMAGFEEITNQNYKVTVEVGEEKINLAMETIEKMGGTLDDRNVY
ncbi:conserved hypothetical protein [Alkaliphilus metalliredigens QYMF]|uniref:Uncharacterized protein n=1 Tax=Alkaliphilus metalliredigens (strain QYMF) TaxID=293826 RepID=A6TM30_ALKMQ|nr:hypothetical protein [Alkaliphilus metalliredigens]ABR47248.1 conserved hypothetical protein [Alkaliphilus metalliredigens QYMF]